jgi:hypothetical protein
MPMAHITLRPDLPGIRGPMAFRPETAKPLNELVEILYVVRIRSRPASAS